MIAREQLAEMLELAGFARRMAAMMGSGVTVAAALAAVAEDAGETELAADVREVRARVMDGATLSEAMKLSPERFDEVAVNMTRSGEVGGVLDITMHRWAELLERQIELHERLRQYEVIAKAAGESDRSETAVAQARDAGLPVLAASLFLDALGVMLSSGVPLGTALDTAADFLPEAQAGTVRSVDLAQLTEEADLSGELAAIPELAGTVRELLRVGEMTGTLDEACVAASELLRADAEAGLRAAMLG